MHPSKPKKAKVTRQQPDGQRKQKLLKAYALEYPQFVERVLSPHWAMRFASKPN